MSARRLALVANFHRERLIGRKTAEFVGRVQAHLASRGIALQAEFVLDRPDETTLRQIEASAENIPGARLHVIENGDLGAARRHGVEATRAEVVCFLDGDDLFSMNWFEAALDRLDGPLRREVVHTQYMVGFDRDRFIRETVESADPTFDPLSLAVRWYWSANLAIRQEVFAEVPIQAYDHDAGFGSEDWDWACNTLAAGIARVSVPGTSYYYRVKPKRFSLGRTGDLINKASRLFSAAGLPPPPATPSPSAPPLAPPGPEFYAQAREIEPYEIGLSFLREVETGALIVPHYKPHTTPDVGRAWREALASGFGDGSVVVFADAQRTPGGLATALALGDAVGGRIGAARLYIIAGEGEAKASRAAPDGYILSIDSLRAHGLIAMHVARFVARFLVQASDLTVVDLLSPRGPSTALSFSRATRASVTRWIAIVMEHGFDALSRAWDALDAFDAAGIACEKVALFAETAEQAARVRGVVLLHDPALEAAFVRGEMEGVAFTPAPPDLAADCRGRPSPAQSRVFHLAPGAFIREAPGGGALRVDAGLRALAEREAEVVLVSGEARLGWNFPSAGASRRPGLTIPALTIIDRDPEPTLLVRHPVEDFAETLRVGGFPMNLAATGALGIDAASLRLTLERQGETLSLCELIRTAVAAALHVGVAPVRLFAPHAVAQITREAVDLIDRAALARCFADAAGGPGP